MKTIRQIADEIGVSKQAVYKRYKGKLHTVCAPYTHTEQGVLYLSEQAETLIKQDFLKDDRSLEVAWEPTGPACWYISTPGFKGVCPVGLFVKV